MTLLYSHMFWSDHDIVACLDLLACREVDSISLDNLLNQRLWLRDGGIRPAEEGTSCRVPRDKRYAHDESKSGDPA